jgi:hypothetical protein
MTGLELLLALAGLVVTALVVAGMILITPRGEVQLDGAVRDPQGASLSRADVPDGGRGDLPHEQRPAA